MHNKQARPRPPGRAPAPRVLRMRRGMCSDCDTPDYVDRMGLRKQALNNDR